ncbi:hypothetical protein P4533_00155 [Geobacillus stearothermophilus]|uniref:hypothetical protein n=1 Tax=Geobacillus stearothermophilus TaxID=1422 RepID=UPI002E1D72CB|nr:hypothetical protein [Geobacillus stearothermophilus]
MRTKKLSFDEYPKDIREQLEKSFREFVFVDGYVVDYEGSGFTYHISIMDDRLLWEICFIDSEKEGIYERIYESSIELRFVKKAAEILNRS